MTTAHRPPKTAPAQPAIEDSLDPLAGNRKVPVPLAKNIPPPGLGYVPLSLDRRQRLSKLSDDLRSEAHAALAEVTSNRERFLEDLGDLAPSPELALSLAERLKSVEAAVTATESLLLCLQDLERIAVHDTVSYLQAINEELQHRLPKRPNLSTTYAKLRTLFDMRGAAVAEGMARARRRSNSGQPSTPVGG